MSEINATTQPATWRIWLQAVRPFAYPASVVPVLVGAMLALSYEGEARWALFPLALICSVLFHTGTNLVSDAADFKRGVDREGTYGSSGVLVAGLLRPEQVFWGGVAAFALGCLLGLAFVWIRDRKSVVVGKSVDLGGARIIKKKN